MKLKIKGKSNLEREIDNTWIRDKPALILERNTIAKIFKDNGIIPHSYIHEYFMRVGYEQGYKDAKEEKK